MNSLKINLLDELLNHLSKSQGGDLKSMLDESKNPKMEEGSPEEEALETPSEEEQEDGKPKGLSIEKIQVMGKPQTFDEKAKEAIADASGIAADKKDSLGSAIGYPGFPKPKPKGKPTAMLGEESHDPNKPGEEDMSDDELNELLKKYNLV